MSEEKIIEKPQCIACFTDATFRYTLGDGVVRYLCGYHLEELERAAGTFDIEIPEISPLANEVVPQ